MTNGDMIRAMSDERLADLLTELLRVNRDIVLEKLREKGVAMNVEVVEMPLLNRAAHLQWLREEME